MNNSPAIEELTKDQFFKLIGADPDMHIDNVVKTVWDTLQVGGYKIVKQSNELTEDVSSWPTVDTSTGFHEKYYGCKL